ncbi:MAG: hypothetical protein WHS46_10640 [Desulfosoma sp.]
MSLSQIPENPPLNEEIIATLRRLVQEEAQSLIGEKIVEFVRANEQRAKELSLLERIIRVEEELKALRQIEADRFQAINDRFVSLDKRFEALLREIQAHFEAVDKRFEATDKRFEALMREIQARFEAVDKRFEAMDKRFEAMDKRFEAMEKRFEAVDKRFEAMDKRFTMLQWTMGIGFSFLAVLIGILKF